MSDRRWTRLIHVALCALIAASCRTVAPASDGGAGPATVGEPDPAPLVEGFPESPLRVRSAGESDPVSVSALAVPVPPNPEPSLEPSRPTDGAFTTALALPEVPPTVAGRETERLDDRAPVSTPSPSEAFNGVPRSSPSSNGLGESPDAVRPTSPANRVTSGPPASTGEPRTARSGAGETPPSVPPVDRLSPNRGDRTANRDGEAPVVDRRSTDGAHTPLDRPPVALRTPTPSTTDGREEAFPVSNDTATTRNVRPGDLFVVQLPGRSWIFVGPTDGVEFVDRRTVADGIEFAFRLRESEDGRPVALRFESQDLVDGSRRIHTETVESSDLVRLAGGDGETRTDGTANRERGAETDTPHRGPMETASVDGTTPDTEEIIASIGSGDFHTLDMSDEELRERVSLLEAREEYAAQARLLEALFNGGVLEGDWVLYTLARLLESSWEGRDIRRARDMYLRLVDEYPFSLYWDAAGERIEFLNRHFFYIR